MYLTERHVINKNHEFYKECDSLSFKSKNLYNFANYIVRNHFIITKHYLNYNEIQKYLQGFHESYSALPAKVSQQTLKLLDKNWKSFFKSIKEYNKNPKNFLGRPGLPKYKDKVKGRNIVVYTNQAIGKNNLLSQTGITVPTYRKNIKQIRIVPENQRFIIEVVYKKNRKLHKLNKNNIIAVDLGVTNLAAITSNVILPEIINGKPLKSINQFFNKEKARLQKLLPKKKKVSNRILSLTNKRNNKINNYLHNASRYLINCCLTNNVGTIVIGYNEGWKQEINIGKRNNQNFTNIPFRKFIDQIKYKSKLVGIEVVVVEESYTSKCSLLDNEKLCKKEKYSGRRIKRGLYKSKEGILLNADINGSGNIFRKAFPRVKANGIEDLLVNPVRVTPYKLAS